MGKHIAKVDERAAREAAFSPKKMARVALRQSIRAAFKACLHYAPLSTMTTAERASALNTTERHLDGALRGVHKVPLRWLAEAARLTDASIIVTAASTPADPSLN